MPTSARHVRRKSSVKIRHIYPNRTVTTLAGGNSSGTTTGSTNGVGTTALFGSPRSVAVDTSGNVIVADYSNHKTTNGEEVARKKRSKKQGTLDLIWRAPRI